MPDSKISSERQAHQINNMITKGYRVTGIYTSVIGDAVVQMSNGGAKATVYWDGSIADKHYNQH